jgi:hypothetical protein
MNVFLHSGILVSSIWKCHDSFFGNHMVNSCVEVIDISWIDLSYKDSIPVTSYTLSTASPFILWWPNLAIPFVPPPPQLLLHRRGLRCRPIKNGTQSENSRKNLLKAVYNVRCLWLRWGRNDDPSWWVCIFTPAFVDVPFVNVSHVTGASFFH